MDADHELKRSFVNKRYATEISAMYGERRWPELYEGLERRGLKAPPFAHTGQPGGDCNVEVVQALALR